MADEKDAFLVGHTIFLRPPEDDDVLKEGWHSWYNDQRVTRFNSHGVYPISRTQEIALVRDALSAPNSILLAIVEQRSNRLLGNASLQDIDLLNRRCRIALTIGETASLTTGVEVYGLLLQHAFTRLNLERVFDATHEALADFVAMLGVVGFSVEGRFSRHFLRDRKFSDAIAFAALADRFFELQRARGGDILFETHAQLADAVVDSVRKSR